jgi:malate synthase
MTISLPAATRSEVFAAIPGVEILGAIDHLAEQVLTPGALELVARLARACEDRRRELLAARSVRQHRIAEGERPDFLPQTRAIREATWTVSPIPKDLLDRRVEITGPVDRKMIINALNSGARVFMADFEDSHSPTWRGTLEGQLNLSDAVRGTIDYQSPDGKHYALGDSLATLMVRPRGWHLDEKHLRVDGRPVSAALFDFALFFFHNAEALIRRGSGPYFYLPKMESHLEARLWNEVFVLAQDTLGIPRGTIRATALVETVLAAFEMHEILWELREHSAGLNCGRWDYIFSFIKKFRNDRRFVLPDRAAITMDRPFLKSYADLLIQTCHRRHIHAMGGMAAQIPVKNDPAANTAALAKVMQDKLREVNAAHDGTWVAHPGLVPVARGVFDARMAASHQLPVTRDDVRVTAADLLAVPDGDITIQGLRTNIDVGIQYLESWLRGTGCVPIYNLMEDAATAEISRTQVWQWVTHGAKLADGRRVTTELVRRTMAVELGKLREQLGPARFDSGKFDLASQLFDRMMTGTDFPEFLTTVAYDHID